MRATAAATLALMDPEWGTKMPLFIMAPGALATFSGSDLCHGTTEHDDSMMCGVPRRRLPCSSEPIFYRNATCLVTLQAGERGRGFGAVSGFTLLY